VRSRDCATREELSVFLAIIGLAVNGRTAVSRANYARERVHVMGGLPTVV